MAWGPVDQLFFFKYFDLSEIRGDDTMHYVEVEKRGLKWSTLTNYFSTNFQRKFTKLGGMV